MASASFEKYSLTVRVDGKVYRVDSPLPEGVTEGVYESGWARVTGGFDMNCFQYCPRCTAARNTLSGREPCMHSNSMTGDEIIITPDNFFDAS